MRTRALRYTVIFLIMLFATLVPVSTSAQVYISSEMWEGDPDGGGNTPIYGQAIAEVEGIGVVQARAFLYRPSGGTLDSDFGPSSPVSYAEVETSVHPNTTEVGWYRTLGEGWQYGELYGCQDYWFGIGIFIASYTRNSGGCEPGLCIYWAHCDHDCQSSAQYYYADVGPYLHEIGQIFVVFWPWCVSAEEYGASGPACLYFLP